MKNKKSKTVNRNVRIANISLLVTLFLFVLLIYRAGVLSLSEKVDGINLKEFASKRTIKHETILAKRGTIYDVNGEALAQNVYSYTLIAYLDSSRGEGNYVKDKENTAKGLSSIISMDYEKILALLNRNVYQTEFGNSGKGLTELTKDKILALNLDGITFTETQKRYYPKGDFLSYTLGYAKSNEDGKIIGEMGIEALFNDSLTGTDGFKEYQKDLKGYKIANTLEKVQEQQDGNSIYLTIDSNVQFFIEQALEDANNKYHQPFILNKELLGKWKIKEILPNIHFNPDKQKSNPSSTYMILEFNNDGTTNFKNVKWSDNFLFIVTDNGVIANFMNIMKINDKEYLEIRMNDMSTIYYHAKPISYIYER